MCLLSASQFIIFGDFVGRCLVRRCTFLCGSVVNVWFCISVWDSDIPGHWLGSGPWDQCGRFPFCRIKFAGSFVAGICARFTALHRMSFMELCRCCLGELLRQERPCSPRASTGFPHVHVCGSHALQPSLLAGQPHHSDSLRPIEANGGACSQSPGWLDAATRSLALPMSHWALDWSKDACFVAKSWNSWSPLVCCIFIILSCLAWQCFSTLFML